MMLIFGSSDWNVGSGLLKVLFVEDGRLLFLDVVVVIEKWFGVLVLMDYEIRVIYRILFGMFMIVWCV